jgi:hypothetical protein
MVSPLENQRHQGDFVTLAPSDVPTVEIAWRDRPASHRAAERGSPDPRIRIVSGTNSPETPIPELKLLAEDNKATHKPSIGRRMIRGVARFCITALIGVGATLAWQSHGDQAGAILKTWTVSLGQRLVDPTTKSAPESLAPAQPAIPLQAAAQDETLRQSRSNSQALPAFAGQAESAAASTQQLEAIARTVVAVQKGIEQLNTKQEEMARNIATLRAAERDIRSKLSPAPQSMVVVPLPPRKKIVAGAPAGPAGPAAPSSAEPASSTRPVTVARPPLYLDPTR